MEVLVAIALLWLVGKSESIGKFFSKPDMRSWPEIWAEETNQPNNPKEK